MKIWNTCEKRLEIKLQWMYLYFRIWSHLPVKLCLSLLPVLIHPNFTLKYYLIFFASGSFSKAFPSDIVSLVPQHLIPTPCQGPRSYPTVLIICNQMWLFLFHRISHAMSPWCSYCSLAGVTSPHIKPGIMRTMMQHLSDGVILGIKLDYNGKFILVLSKEITFYILRILYIQPFHVL